MSDRLTSKWTENAAQAFGATGVKGDAGEKMMLQWLLKHPINNVSPLQPIHHGADRIMQKQGIDITWRCPSSGSLVSCDVKANLTDDGIFYVYHDEWLYKSKADKITHVNTKTGEIVSYNTEQMKAFCKTLEEALQRKEWDTLRSKYVYFSMSWVDWDNIRGRQKRVPAWFKFSRTQRPDFVQTLQEAEDA